MLALASIARASEQFGDLDVSFLSLQVNEHGVALVTYRTTSGAIRHVYVWGAINANAPDAGRAAGAVPATTTRGGLKRDGRQTWQTFSEPLPSLRRAEARLARGRLQGARRLLLGAATLAATAADARDRAVQARARTRSSCTSRTGRGRSRCSRCRRTGRYGGRWQGLFGRLTYLGKPSFGFRTPSSRRRDSYARFFYVDTFDSAFGPGWKHDAGKVAHSRNGAFCYSFVPQWTPAGYPRTSCGRPGTASVTGSR